MHKTPWQLYDEQGRPIPGKSASSHDVYSKGLLHAAAHVWVWRQGKAGPEVLLQKRAPWVATWPDKLDISAAGHLDGGNNPVEAAIREVEEEIGLKISEDQLWLVGVERRYLVTNTKTENEFAWIFTLRVTKKPDFKFADGEVESVVWKPLKAFQAELKDPKTKANYVPHGPTYFAMLFDGLELHSQLQ